VSATSEGYQTAVKIGKRIIGPRGGLGDGICAE
jgi:hypothetical protein